MNREEQLEKELSTLKESFQMSERERTQVEQVYERCSRDKKQHQYIKIGVKCATLALVFIMGIGVIGVLNPSLAKGNAVLYKLFEGLHETLFKDTPYEKYAEPKEMCVRDGDLEVTLEEVFCDQRELGYTYTLKSYGEPLKKGDLVYSTVWINVDLFINGKPLNSGGDGGSGEYIDDYTYKGRRLYESRELLPEQFELDLHFKNFESAVEEHFSINGDWKFKTQVTKHTSPDSRVVKVDRPFNIPTIEAIQIKEIGFTPINTYLVMESPLDKKIGKVMDIYDLDFTLIDNLGQVYQRGNGGMRLTEDDIYQWHLEFSVPEQVPDWVAVVPSIVPLGEGEWIPADRIVKVPYEEQVVIKRENIGDYIIKSIENKENGISVKVELEPMQSHTHLRIGLRDGEERTGESKVLSSAELEIFYEGYQKEDIVYFALYDYGENYQLEERIEIQIP